MAGPAQRPLSPVAFDDLERQRVRKAVRSFVEARRPPEHLRGELDLGYRIEGQSVEIFEIRPQWDDPSTKIEGSVAKATYVRSRDVWKIYWKRADLRWHGYHPNPEVETIDEVLTIVDADDHACFFG